MLFERLVDINTLAWALVAVVLSAFKECILPSTHLLHLGWVWQMQINVFPKDISATAGFEARTYIVAYTPRRWANL